MRNGDFAPTRLHAQTEAVHMLADLKTQGNAETEVGLLTMAGKRYGRKMSPGLAAMDVA